MVCKLCKSPSTRVKREVKSPHNGEFYHLYFCTSCRSHFFDVAQFEVSLKNLYEDLSKCRGEFPEDFSPSRKWQKHADLIERISRSPVTSILDVGCRTGDFLMHFKPEVQREGIELSDHFAEIARKRGLTIYNDYIENVSFPRTYDIITSFAILEHLENPLVFLDKLSAILNPSGLLVVLIPTYNCLKRRLIDLWGKHWHMYTPPEHLNYFSRRFLDTYLGSKGFRLVKRYYTSGGMGGNFKNLPMMNKPVRKSLDVFDSSVLNRLPVFDHMYNYYASGN